jgi:membrane-bound lytic murein transglycosylase B
MKYIIVLLSVFLTFLNAKDYTKNKEVISFIDTVSKTHDIDKSYLYKLFSNVTIQKTPLKIYQPHKKTKPSKQVAKLYPKYGAWDRYVKYKVTPKRVAQGSSFIQKYDTIFQNVEKQYGVPAEYIAAIIGIETVYGKNVGKYPVFDTLTTLAFEKNRRNNFFKKQLEEFIILISQYNKTDPKTIKGSYAGAMGLGQFMPSSYKHFGVDYNQDGEINLDHPEDTIASIANYLKDHGWKSDEKVATRVSYKGNRFRKYKTGYNITYNRRDLKGIKPKYGKWDYFKKVRLIKLNKKAYDELWYATKNFYVITRYNHSAYYAMSVHQLAQKIKHTLSRNDTLAIK